ncbi:hypothetical protein OOT46_09370 [Aquabacterium sp. A7-Y]|uniref:hypothetical protein n=1 Tax=Aquabacterium sp. A7-Y TaxID=1349605 RepID=UPI00223DE72B|nr:hypothetical protein [Aquabacterium sp. A7-Y]MCW7538056.1 hypothetical protein [Aquabacterium sp. A7-Y]
MPVPGRDQLLQPFKGQPNRVCFSGHYDDLQLWGNKKACVWFEKDGVELMSGGASEWLDGAVLLLGGFSRAWCPPPTRPRLDAPRTWG